VSYNNKLDGVKMNHFADEIITKSDEKNSVLVAGLDPNISLFPDFLLSSPSASLEEIGEAIYQFNKHVIDAVHSHVVAVKPQLAYYEVYGTYGLSALEKTIQYAQSKGLIVINDAKRNDIGSTAEAYAEAFLGQGPFAANAVTVNPYLGRDGLVPFVDNGKGLFVLAKTSNPSSHELQDLETSTGEKIYVHTAKLVRELSEQTIGQKGYSHIGVVVGATYPEDAEVIREILPHSLFLVPGFGAQGGSAEELGSYFDKNGFGSLISSSRGITYPYTKERPDDWKKISQDTMMEIIEAAAKQSNKEINQIR
jgi:orotidine-5'-phosphate decarboxylase